MLDTDEPGGGAADVSDLHPVDYSEDALALDFADIYEGEVCYCAQTKHWYVFDGGRGRWDTDTTNLVIYFVREVCRDYAARMRRRWPRDADGYEAARSLLSAKAIEGVEWLARNDRRLAVAAPPDDGPTKGASVIMPEDEAGRST